jgi:hypothetical protein
MVGVAAAAVAVVAVVAGALLMVAGIVVTDGNDGNVVTSSPIVDDPVALPGVTVPDSVLSPSVVDPLEYRWSRAPHDEAAFRGARGQLMKSVTVGGPGLVAVGWVGYDGDAVAAVLSSLDGLTWSRVPHDEAVFGGAHGQWMTDVTVGGPGLVAVGSDGRFSDLDHEATAGERRPWGDEVGAAAVWTSVDGLTWSRVPHDEAVFGADGGQEMNSVTVGGPGLVAVGNGSDHRGADVWTSVDGLTWSLVAHDGERRDFGGGILGPPWTVFGGAQGINSVIAAGPGLVAVGSHFTDAAVWTSVDGLTWSAVPADEAVFGGPGNQMMHSVTVTGAGLVAVGAYGGYDHDYTRFTRPEAMVWTSVDGITWSRVAHDEAVFGGAGMNSVTVAGAGLVAVGDESLKIRGPAAEWDDSVFVWVGEPAP